MSLERQRSADLPHRIAERVAEQRAIAAENGARIIIDPQVAIKALTHYHPTFTKQDMAKFLHTRTAGPEQFRTAYLKVTMSPEFAPMTMADIDVMQQQAAEGWRDKHRTREYEPEPEPGLHRQKDLDPTGATPDQKLKKQLHLEHPSSEDDLGSKVQCDPFDLKHL